LGDTAALHRALLEASVIVRPRLGGIRLAPHFYNDVDDIARVLDVVRAFARRA
jgi:selenocysteine lyase/cysteine desulfurase